MPKDIQKNEDYISNLPFTIIILVLTLFVPLLVLPDVLDNAFNTPKTFLIIVGVSFLIFIFANQFFTGKKIAKSKTSTPKWVMILILLNFISFFYTDNYYYTKVAALTNITCLVFFYFVSLYIDGKKAFWILLVVALSGILISIITYLQFTGHFILIKWARPQTMVMGTIGNSNYLGAYLLFPIFALAGLIFLLKGKFRLIPAVLLFFVFGALLFSRARASWLASGISIPVFLLLIKWIYDFSVTKYIRSNLKHILGYGILIVALIIILWSVAPARFHSMMKLENWTETKTFQFRIKYFRASWWLFKQSPLFGTGLWSYRNRVYDAQAEINRLDPEYFKGYDEPKPRRVHNEYLEILNDGGLIAASFLSIFFVIVMVHGFRIIRDKELETPERVIVATAFSSLTAIMIAACFFFPFRINSTLFMTALMMGIMEGIYIRNRKLISTTEGQRIPFAYPASFLIFLVLVGITWFGAYRPFRGEMEYLKYKKAKQECFRHKRAELEFLKRKKPVQSQKAGKAAKQLAEKAETHILKAIRYDPCNSQYCLNAGRLYTKIIRDYVKAGDYIELAVINFNGDLTKWSVYFTKGLLKFHMGSLFAARDAFQKAIYYNPNFLPARKELKRVENVLKKHDKVLIKLR